MSDLELLILIFCNLGMFVLGILFGRLSKKDTILNALQSVSEEKK